LVKSQGNGQVSSPKLQKAYRAELLWKKKITLVVGEKAKGAQEEVVVAAVEFSFKRKKGVHFHEGGRLG